MQPKMVGFVFFLTIALWKAEALNLSCVTTASINSAFQSAQLQTNFTSISSTPSQYEITQLGKTLEAATTILTKQCGITASELYSALPNVDTSGTNIKKYCPSLFQSYNCTAQRYRDFGGYCNNLANPIWGGVYATYRRWMQPSYTDGISSIRKTTTGSSLPDVRTVALNVHADTNFTDILWTTMFVAWGQLIDHDMVNTVASTDSSGNDLTCCSGSNLDSACMPIILSSNDTFYSTYKVTCLEFARSAVSPKQNCRLGARDQFNEKTSFLDASFLYGSSTNESNSLRTLSGGLLKTQDVFASKGLKPLPPARTVSPDTKCSRPNSTVYCFLTGDIRSNQTPLLSVLHTIFIREHNRIATSLKSINPLWTDEVLFQETRLIVSALVQKITYAEYLPSLLGVNSTAGYGIELLSSGYYTGYNASLNPTLPDVFNGAAFRFGHSMVPSHLDRYNSSHSYLGTKYLRDLFFKPWDMYIAGYFDQYLLGLTNQMAMRSDISISEEMTDHLEQMALMYGSDIASRNIQRGRDHGLPTYNQARAACGLSTATQWSDLSAVITNNTLKALAKVYTSPADLDLFTGGMAEQPTVTPAFGPTFRCIVAETFKKLRAGDRFWFENGGQPSSFTTDQLTEIRKVTLARILCDNSDTLSTVQRSTMTVVDAVKNPRVSCSTLPSMNLTKWKQ